MFFFNLGPRALEMLRVPRYLNPALCFRSLKMSWRSPQNLWFNSGSLVQAYFKLGPRATLTRYFTDFFVYLFVTRHEVHSISTHPLQNTGR